MPEPIAELRGVVKRYGLLEVVAGLSLSVQKTECVGLLGPNGAGKTTTLKLLTGQGTATSGEVKLFGIPYNERSKNTRSRIGVVTQDDTLDEELTAFENLLVFARYFGIPVKDARQRAEELLAFVHLSEKHDARVPALSGGMRRRLLIARALVNAPDFLILDEPTTGLDPQARHLIWQKLRLLKRQGVTMLLTTHYMEEAEQLCDRLLILESGRALAQGRPIDLIREHVGEEVIELRSGALSPEALRSQLGFESFDTELSADTLYVFLRPGRPAPAEIPRIEGVDFLHRRATLEDVFLRLAGRELSE
ncbi:MAG: ATP-binding cassette domain-containing protein [Bdellovibrionota bacterium]